MLGDGKRRETLMVVLCGVLGVVAILLLSIGIATQAEPLDRMIAQAREAIAQPKPTPTFSPSTPPATEPPETEPSTPHGPVARNVSAWITSDDYPAAALSADQQGTVAMELQIDASGTVTGCIVTQSSGFPVLDNTTCRLGLTRARFFPARDAAGVGLPSTWRRRVVWQMPE